MYKKFCKLLSIMLVLALLVHFCFFAACSNDDSPVLVNSVPTSESTAAYYLNPDYWYSEDAKKAVESIPVYVLDTPYLGFKGNAIETQYELYIQLKQRLQLNYGKPLTSFEDYKQYILAFHREIRLCGYTIGFPDKIFYYSDNVIEVRYPSIQTAAISERCKGRAIEGWPDTFKYHVYDNLFLTISVDCNTGELIYMG